jgi:hypothetical protein
MKKWCFVAREIKGGWRLKLAYGSKDYPVRGIIFKKMEEIQQLTHDGKIVFVHLNDRCSVFGCPSVVATGLTNNAVDCEHHRKS